jgi:hypothetical protein
VKGKGAARIETRNGVVEGTKTGGTCKGKRKQEDKLANEKQRRRGVRIEPVSALL